MIFKNRNHTLLFLFLILLCKEISCLKCYQCSSTSHRGCFKYNLNSEFLKDCNSSRTNPVCRSLSQVHFFTPAQDVTMVRECAYTYEHPLGCIQSKFSGLHYSLSCECNEDGCNSAIIVHRNWRFILLVVVLCSL